jgi:phasin family protein
MKNQAEKLGETAKNNAQAMFADAKERTEDAMAKSQKFFAEMADFNKGNIEALVESSRVAARALEQMGREAAEEARKSFEATQTAVKTLAQVKSPTEFMRLQSEFARTAFDHAVAQASRNTESMLKLAGEIAQPISNRMALAADKMKVAA